MRKASVYGKNRAFVRYLEACVGAENISAVDRIEQLPAGGAVFLLPDYDLGHPAMEEFSEEEVLHLRYLLKENTTIYLENYPAYDYRDCFLFGVQALGYLQRIRGESVKVYGQPFEILQKRGGYFFPNHLRIKGCVPLLEIRNLIGSHKILQEEEACAGYALVKKEEQIFCAMLDISNFQSEFTLPYVHWKKVFGTVFSEILQISCQTAEEAFGRTYQKIGTNQSQNASYDLRECVRKAVEWHLRSGILPREDGTGGIYEMFRSFDLAPAKNLRGDAGMFTAVLLECAAKYFGEEKWSGVAHNIFRRQLVECNLQITTGNNRGLYRWFTDSEDNTFVYASDSARVGNNILAWYRVTGEEACRARAESTGEAFLRWFGGKALMPVGYFDFAKEDLDSLAQKEEICDAPEFYEPVMLFFRNLYEVTGDERYREQIHKTAVAFAGRTEYGVQAAHSKNFTYARLLGIFSVAQQFGDGPWSKKIGELLEYFSELQEECGGIAEGGAYLDFAKNKNAEFSVAFGGENDKITDIMYCCNTVLTSLYILRKTPFGEGVDMARAEAIFSALTKFLCRVQICSEDVRLDGGWMRAYDMELEEYYGCDKDFAWGPYSILTGWMTGAIPLVFLGLLGRESLY